MTRLHHSGLDLALYLQYLGETETEAQRAGLQEQADQGARDDDEAGGRRPHGAEYASIVPLATSRDRVWGAPTVESRDQRPPEAEEAPAMGRHGEKAKLRRATKRALSQTEAASGHHPRRWRGAARRLVRCVGAVFAVPPTVDLSDLAVFTVVSFLYRRRAVGQQSVPLPLDRLPARSGGPIDSEHVTSISRIPPAFDVLECAEIRTLRRRPKYNRLGS